MYKLLRRGFHDAPTFVGPNGEVILNLARNGIEHIDGVPSNVNVLILDHNYIRRLENLVNLNDLQQLSASNNKLLQMHGVAQLTGLTILNLPNNGIVTIDGLAKLVKLRWLNLSGNRIKAIEQLDYNVNLKHLDLSENCITSLGDLSHLKKLKTLLLHCNRIPSLEKSAEFLPRSLEIMSMASNAVGDIMELRELCCLSNLTQFSIRNNPCADSTLFDCKTFILHHLPQLKVLDGIQVSEKDIMMARSFYIESEKLSTVSTYLPNKEENRADECETYPVLPLRITPSPPAVSNLENLSNYQEFAIKEYHDDIAIQAHKRSFDDDIKEMSSNETHEHRVHPATETASSVPQNPHQYTSPLQDVTSANRDGDTTNNNNYVPTNSNNHDDIPAASFWTMASEIHQQQQQQNLRISSMKSSMISEPMLLDSRDPTISYSSPSLIPSSQNTVQNALTHITKTTETDSVPHSPTQPMSPNLLLSESVYLPVSSNVNESDQEQRMQHGSSQIGCGISDQSIPNQLSKATRLSSSQQFFKLSDSNLLHSAQIPSEDLSLRNSSKIVQTMNPSPNSHPPNSSIFKQLSLKQLIDNVRLLNDEEDNDAYLATNSVDQPQAPCSQNVSPKAHANDVDRSWSGLISVGSLSPAVEWPNDPGLTEFTKIYDPLIVKPLVSKPLVSENVPARHQSASSPIKSKDIQSKSHPISPSCSMNQDSNSPVVFDGLIQDPDSSSGCCTKSSVCPTCGSQTKLLHDHIIFLRTQLQAQFKAAEAETKLRQLHSKAIEFLMKEVQELKSWRETTMREIRPSTANSRTTVSTSVFSKYTDLNPPQSISPTCSRSRFLRHPSAPSGDTPIPEQSTIEVLAEVSHCNSASSCTPDSKRGKQLEVVKVYASDEDPEEGSLSAVTSIVDREHTNLYPAVELNRGRSNDDPVLHTDSIEERPNHPIFIDHEQRNKLDLTQLRKSATLLQTEHVEDDVSDIELVRQAALRAMNLNTPSDSETIPDDIEPNASSIAESPRHSKSKIINRSL